MLTSPRQSSQPGVTPLLAGVGISFVLALVSWRHTLNVPFFALSADDFSRVLMAWQVTQGVLIPSEIWPPLPFWINALVLLIYPHPLVVPLLVNLASSSCTLIGLLMLGQHLGLRRSGMLMLAVLAGSMPWFIWLTLSGLAEPIFFTCTVGAYLGLAYWASAARERWLWVAALALLGAGMVRFEGWGQNAVFTLLILVRLWLAPAPRPRTWLVAALLPWLFPVLWLGYQYAVQGSPFWFIKIVSTYYQLMSPARSPLELLLFHPARLWEVGGPALLLAPIGIWLQRRCPAVALLCSFWLGSFGLLMLSTLGQNLPTHNPQRSAVIFALLALPASALALQRLAHSGVLGLLATMALVAALAFPRLQALPSYPSGLAADVMAVGQHLDGLRTIGELRPGDQVLIEVLFWDYIVLHALANDPAGVIYDRLPEATVLANGTHQFDEIGNPSLLALPPAQLARTLHQRQVRAVVTYSERASANLRPIARETFQAGRFRVFVLVP